ncbi:MAG: aldo/keto reductase [Clostridia bacterium]|nr:aldo/keto reductase [Clostridia bacterium]
MKTKLLCGKKISALTLGTVQLGLAYGVNNERGMPTYEESASILNTATDEGICSFDTARAYGESEAVLGRYFKENAVPRTVITKAAIYDAAPENFEDELFSSVRTSLKCLGAEKVDAVMFHNEKMFDKYGDVAARALQKLRAEGLCDCIGTSFSDKTRLYEYSTDYSLDCVQIPANMFDAVGINDGIVQKLAEQGTFVFVRSLYLQGLFFKNTDTLTGKLSAAKESLDSLSSLAREAGLGMAEMAVAYIRDSAGVGSLVLGCDTPDQLRESCRVVNSPSLSDSLRGEIERIAERVPSIVVRPWDWYK